MRQLYACLILFAAGCNADNGKPADKAPAAQAKAGEAIPAPADLLAAQAKAPGPKLLPEEERVRAFILDNANDPKSVEFAKWGPHDLKAEGSLTKWQSLPTGFMESLNQKSYVPLPEGPLRIVRVRYRMAGKGGARELHDSLFAVTADSVFAYRQNLWGDRWRAELVEQRKAADDLLRPRD